LRHNSQGLLAGWSSVECDQVLQLFLGEILIIKGNTYTIYALGDIDALFDTFPLTALRSPDWGFAAAPLSLTLTEFGVFGD
jgi:hypothetical protein